MRLTMSMILILTIHSFIHCPIKFKAATEAFESAVNCPIAGSMGRVWKEYAKFQQERNRNKTAQKIYLRALVGEGNNPAAVEKVQDQDDLWLAFLDMMKSLSEDEELTLQQLKDAVRAEHRVQNNSNVKAEPVEYEEPMVAEITAEIEQPAKRAKLEMSANTFVPDRAVVSASTVEATASELLGRTKDIPAEITAEWLGRDGDHLPSRPEPPLFTPSPPRLSDPSGKDLLGTEMSLKLIRLLVGHSDGGIAGCAILDICRGCWMMTALKEREATKCIEALDKKLVSTLSLILLLIYYISVHYQLTHCLI